MGSGSSAPDLRDGLREVCCNARVRSIQAKDCPPWPFPPRADEADVGSYMSSVNSEYFDINDPDGTKIPNGQAQAGASSSSSAAPPGECPGQAARPAPPPDGDRKTVSWQDERSNQGAGKASPIPPKQRDAGPPAPQRPPPPPQLPRGVDCRALVFPQSEEQMAEMTLQAARRESAARQQLAKERAAATTVQAAQRGSLVRKQVRQEHQAATVVQAAYRGSVCREELDEQRWTLGLHQALRQDFCRAPPTGAMIERSREARQSGLEEQAAEKEQATRLGAPEDEPLLETEPPPQEQLGREPEQ